MSFGGLPRWVPTFIRNVSFVEKWEKKVCVIAIPFCCV